jgi:SH3 domain-containing YSC84-like protein 1
MRSGFIFTALLLTAATAAAAPTKGETTRLANAATVIKELRSAPDKGVPESVWDKARCVAVMPAVKKAALGIGGEFGKGVVSCRYSQGWSAPVFLTLEKGSFGAQLGAQSTDLVLLIMNDRGIERLLQDKVTLGADASLATDAQLSAEMLSYSHARGLFAGVDLSGGVLRLDNHANEEFYGHTVAGRDVLLGNAHERMPAAATTFIAALNGAPKHSSKRATH